MKKNQNKYTLLNKEQDGDIEMVEMDEYSRPKYASGNAKLPDNNYVTFKDEQVPQPKPQKQNTQKAPQNAIPSSQQRTNQQRQYPQYQQGPYQQGPYQQGPYQQGPYVGPRVTQYQIGGYPNYYNAPVITSSNPRATVIRMNGTNFQKQQMGQPPQQQQNKKRSQIPDMEVACTHCTFKQNVPGNTQIYACCCCNNMSECYPLYGMFICGSCQGKVCYPYGTSDMIKCTRCQTINKVPIEPKKKYVSQPPVEQVPVNKKEEEKKQAERFEEQIDFLDVEDEPEVPRKKQPEFLLEEELFFDDIPAPNSKKEDRDLSYPDM